MTEIFHWRPDDRHRVRMHQQGLNAVMQLVLALALHNKDAALGYAERLHGGHVITDAEVNVLRSQIEGEFFRREGVPLAKVPVAPPMDDPILPRRRPRTLFDSMRFIKSLASGGDDGPKAA